MERIEWRNAPDELIAESVAFANTLRAESSPGDPPLKLVQQIAAIRAMPAFLRTISYLIRDGAGGIIAACQIGIERSEDNQHVANVGVNVLPAHRRKRLATSLLAKVLEEAQTEERTRLIGSTSETVPAGAAFAERIGATPGLREHTNRLALDEIDRTLIEAWIKQGPERAQGYSLIWHDGSYPPQLRDRMIPVHELMNHAPTEDLDIEDWKITAEQSDAWDAQAEATGLERWTLIARHDATDTFVGFTETAVSPSQPKTVFQWGTAVAPEHRGHALGKWLKAAMIDRILRERVGIEDIRTGNADSNGPMLGINTQLGFKPFRAHIAWQMTTDQLRSYLEG